MGKATAASSTAKSKTTRKRKARKASLSPNAKSKTKTSGDMFYESFPIIPRFTRSRSRTWTTPAAEADADAGSQQTTQLIRGDSPNSSVKVVTTTTIQQHETTVHEDPGNPLGNTINFVTDLMPSLDHSMDISTLLKSCFDASVNIDETVMLDLFLCDKSSTMAKQPLEPTVEDANYEASILPKKLQKQKGNNNWKKTLKMLQTNRLLQSIHTKRSRTVEDEVSLFWKDIDVTQAGSSESEDTLFNMEGFDPEFLTDDPDDERDEISLILSQLCNPKDEEQTEPATIDDVVEITKSQKKPRRILWKNAKAFKRLKAVAALSSFKLTKQQQRESSKTPEKNESTNIRFTKSEEPKETNHENIPQVTTAQSDIVASPKANDDEIANARSKSLLSQRSARLLRKKRLQQALGQLKSRQKANTTSSPRQPIRLSWKKMMAVSSSVPSKKRSSTRGVQVFVAETDPRDKSEHESTDSDPLEYSESDTEEEASNKDHNKTNKLEESTEPTSNRSHVITLADLSSSSIADISSTSVMGLQEWAWETIQGYSEQLDNENALLPTLNEEDNEDTTYSSTLEGDTTTFSGTFSHSYEDSTLDNTLSEGDDDDQDSNTIDDHANWIMDEDQLSSSSDKEEDNNRLALPRKVQVDTAGFKILGLAGDTDTPSAVVSSSPSSPTSPRRETLLAAQRKVSKSFKSLASLKLKRRVNLTDSISVNTGISSNDWFGEEAPIEAILYAEGRDDDHGSSRNKNTGAAFSKAKSFLQHQTSQFNEKFRTTTTTTTHANGGTSRNIITVLTEDAPAATNGETRNSHSGGSPSYNHHDDDDDDDESVDSAVHGGYLFSKYADEIIRE